MWLLAPPPAGCFRKIWKNSWLDKWGQGGYGFLPYAYVEHYMMDVWSSVDIEDPNPLTLASVLRSQKRV